MKVEYTCRKCGEVFIVDRKPIFNREKSYEELLLIGKNFLFPHFEYHYGDSKKRFIVFAGFPGDDYDMYICKELQDKIGVCLCYSLVVGRNNAGEMIFLC